MTRANKEALVSTLSERFGQAKATYLVDFKGMTVEQVTDLRKKLTPVEAEMRVVRNTLAKRALQNHPDTEQALSDKLIGTNAFVFAFGDISEPAKIISDFSKTVEALQVKSGVMDGKALDAAKITYLSTLPSKDVLRAQLLGLFSQPASKFVRTLAAVPGGFARVLAAYKETKE